MISPQRYGGLMAPDFEALMQRLMHHEFWRGYLVDAFAPGSAVGFHVAVFSEPFLTAVLTGEKTIESRFSSVRCAPYGEVAVGDIVLIKRVAGPVCGVAVAAN